MKNKKGFTLIELLAIIIILAIIAVITVPIILNIIEKSKKGTSKDSTYGIVDAAKKSYFKLNNQTMETQALNCSFPQGCDELKFNGKEPTSGNIRVSETGTVNGEVTFYDKYTFCVYNNEVLDGTCKETISQTIKEQVKQTGSTHIYNQDQTIDINKIYNCIEYDITVATGLDPVTFCLIGETNDTITLITKDSIGSTQWGDLGATTNWYGPKGIFQKLLDVTKSWTNISPVTNYSYDDNNTAEGNHGYKGVSITDGKITITEKDETQTIIGNNSSEDASNQLRARALTKEETLSITDTGTIIPEWLEDVWTITSNRTHISEAWLIYKKNVTNPSQIEPYVIHDSHKVKAVITLNKSEL